MWTAKSPTIYVVIIVLIIYVLSSRSHGQVGYYACYGQLFALADNTTQADNTTYYGYFQRGDQSKDCCCMTMIVSSHFYSQKLYWALF